jgi:hypothetical protein
MTAAISALAARRDRGARSIHRRRQLHQVRHTMENLLTTIEQVKNTRLHPSQSFDERVLVANNRSSSR